MSFIILDRRPYFVVDRAKTGKPAAVSKRTERLHLLESTREAAALVRTQRVGAHIYAGIFRALGKDRH
jgi:hypothetical protein